MVPGGGCSWGAGWLARSRAPQVMVGGHTWPCLAGPERKWGQSLGRVSVVTEPWPSGANRCRSCRSVSWTVTASQGFLQSDSQQAGFPGGPCR